MGLYSRFRHLLDSLILLLRTTHVRDHVIRSEQRNNKLKFVVAEQPGTISGFRKVNLSADCFLLNKFAGSNNANCMLFRNQVTKFVEEARSCVAKRMRGKSTHTTRVLPSYVLLTMDIDNYTQLGKFLVPRTPSQFPCPIKL